MWPPRTILCPTDFSKYSEHAFDLACGLARLNQAKVIVLHVHAPPAVTPGGMPPSLVEVEDETQAERRLNLIRPREPDANVERFMVTGNTGESILNIARTSNTDLIVMGTHGRTGMSRLLMGSVAEYVLRRSVCPVLTARPAKEEPRIEVKQASAERKLDPVLAMGLP